MRFLLTSIAFALVACSAASSVAQITEENATAIGKVAGQVTSSKHECCEPLANTAGQKSDRELLDQTRALLRREAKSKSRTASVECAIELVETLNAVRDKRNQSSSRLLQSAEVRLLRRLRQIQARTVTELRTRARPSRIEIDRSVLAQLGRAVGAPAVGDGNQNAALQAGGNQVVANRRQPVLNQDYGPLLVQLIQQTISPGSWDVNGGVASVQYWQPKNVLVIRAPQPVHDEIGPLLLQLRKQ